MPKRSKKVGSVDWDRVERAQKPPASGKDRHARGGNNRVTNTRRYEENFAKIMSTCKNCGAKRPMGEKCEECDE